MKDLELREHQKDIQLAFDALLESLIQMERFRRRNSLPRSWEVMFAEPLDNFGEGLVVLLDREDLQDYQKKERDIGFRKWKWERVNRGFVPAEVNLSYPAVLRVKWDTDDYGTEYSEKLWDPYLLRDWKEPHEEEPSKE